MYNLKSSMSDRIAFDEFQRNAAWEALSATPKEVLADTHNLDGLISTAWEQSKGEIAEQVDDIEEAYGRFTAVWRQEVGAASNAAFQPVEEVA
jgi:hypothetical protein